MPKGFVFDTSKTFETNIGNMPERPLKAHVCSAHRELEIINDLLAKEYLNDNAYQSCLTAAYAALQLLMELEAYLPEIQRERSEATPYSGEEILTQIFESYQDALKLLKKEKIKAATDGFGYLRDIFSAIKAYRNSPTLKLDHLQITITTATDSLKDSEINHQRGFKWLISWVKYFVSDFSTKTYEHTKTLKCSLQNTFFQTCQIETSLQLTQKVRNTGVIDIGKGYSKLQNSLRPLVKIYKENHASHLNGVSEEKIQTDLIENIKSEFLEPDFFALSNKLNELNLSSENDTAVLSFLQCYLDCVKEMMTHCSKLGAVRIAQGTFQGINITFNSETKRLNTFLSSLGASINRISDIEIQNQARSLCAKLQEFCKKPFLEASHALPVTATRN